MIKKEIKFRDFDGKPAEEVHYFHMSPEDLLQMNEEREGGMAQVLTELQTTATPLQMMELFSDLLLRSYGIREEGPPAKFVKNDQVRADFKQTLAYQALLTNCLTNPGNAVEMISGMIPSEIMDHPDMIEAMAKVESGQDLALPKGEENGQTEADKDRLSGLQWPRDEKNVLWPWWNREPTKQEQINMSSHCLGDVTKRKMSDWKPPTQE